MVIVHGKRRRLAQAAQRSRYTLYALNFIFSLHIALTAYYISTFLVVRGVPEAFVGLIYAVGSILALLAIAYAPTLLRRYGNYTNLLALGLVQILTFVGFVLFDHVSIIFLLFLAAFVVPTLIALSLDIFLENATESEEQTSGVRGVFLTVTNLAWLAAPLFGGFLVVGENFDRLFIVAALIFTPFIFFAAAQLRNFKDPKYLQLNIPNFMQSLTTDHDLRNIFVAQFLLRFFYGMMVIYLPLYIHGTLGMPLSSLGIMIAVATMAFVLLEIPLGKLEDLYWGEKEVLIIGFALIAVTTAALSFLTTTSVIIWAAMMFATRIGAAMIDVSSEGYFFKHTNAGDSDDVSAFRMLYPLAYIISPLFGTILLFLVPLQFVFLGTAVVMLLGIHFAGQLHDTK